MSDAGSRRRFFSGSADEPVVGYARAALADPALRVEIEAEAVVPDA